MAERVSVVLLCKANVNKTVLVCDRERRVARTRCSVRGRGYPCPGCRKGTLAHWGRVTCPVLPPPALWPFGMTMDLNGTTSVDSITVKHKSLPANVVKHQSINVYVKRSLNQCWMGSEINIQPHKELHWVLFTTIPVKMSRKQVRSQ